MEQKNVTGYIRSLNEIAGDLTRVDTAIQLINLLYNKLNFEKNNEQLSYDIDTVLHRDNGIWQFLHEVKNHDTPSEPLLNKLYELLEFILVQKSRLSRDQTTTLFHFCNDVTSRVLKPFKVKDFAYKLYFLLAEHGNFQFFIEQAKAVLESLKKLYFETEKAKSTEKQRIFQLLGVFVGNFPLVFDEDQCILKKIARYISKNLTQILEKQDGSKITEIEGMLECLFELLKNFPNHTYDYHETFYNNIMKITKRTSTKHVALRVAIKIIETHFDLFSQYIESDYKYWYELLNTYLNSANKEDSTAAKKALNEFYPKIAKLVYEESPKKNEMLKFFVQVLKKDLQGNNKDKMELAMKHYTRFAESCRNHHEDALVNDMFDLTLCLLNSYCSSFNTLDQDEFINLSNLLYSASEFLRYLDADEFKDKYVKILERATILSFSSFTKVPSKFQFLIKAPLLATIINVAAINESYFITYLENIVYFAMITSCSHMTESDVDILQSTCIVGDNSLLEKLITFKHYLPLWEALFNITIEASKSGDLKLINDIDMEAKICDKYVESMLKIMLKLDLNMKEIDEEDNNHQEKPIMLEYDLAPYSIADFNIFVNLVEMFSSLFSRRRYKFAKWIPTLVMKFIEMIRHHDMKFGFYRMLTIVFKQVKNDKEINIPELKAFMLEELNHLNELPKTDSKACLQMIMNVPNKLLNDIVQNVAPALQTAFERGCEDLALADEALDTLQKWYLNTPKDTFKPILVQVIPYLKPFIQSKRFAGETDFVSQNDKKLIASIISAPRSKQNLKYQRAYVQSMGSELEKLQKKMAKFIGEVDSDIWMTAFTPKTYIEWESVDLLKFPLPFSDMRVDIFLDKFLPRVIDLCYSSDLKTRIAACEVLHSSVIVFLGHSHHLENAFPKDAPNLFKRIITVVLKLGADVNDTVQQLFRPLSIQMAHLYSSKIQKQGIITNAFLEILFDTITVENDPTLRKFAAELIGEFVLWSYKQNEEKSPTNVAAVVRQICLLCLQPCSFKKRGAALAFNSIYKMLRRHESARQDYWLMLLLHFVRNLSTSRKTDCNNVPVTLAINNLSITVIQYFHQFNTANYTSKFPRWFDGKSLFDVQIWLFQQCFSPNERCRTKCMDVLSKILDGNENRPTLQRFIGAKVKDEFRRGAKELCKHFDKSNISETISWLEVFNAHLHCLRWMLKTDNAALDLFTNEKHGGLLKAVRDFMRDIYEIDPKTYIGAISQQKQFVILREESINGVLQLSAISETITDIFIGKEKWQKNFIDILIKCIFLPREVFAYSRSISELTAILSHLKTNKLRADVLKSIQDHCYWDTFSDILDDQNYVETCKYNPKALFVLNDSGVLADVFEELNFERIVRKIFYYLAHEDPEEKRAILPNITIVSYLENYLTFALKVKFKEKFASLAQYIFNDEILRMNSGKITHGLHFFTVFQKPILEYLLDHDDSFIKQCIDQLDPRRMDMLQMYLKYASTKGKDCSLILKYWTNLNTFASSNDHTIPELLNVVEYATSNKQLNRINELASVYDWMLECLCSSTVSVIIKHQILDLLPSFMDLEFSHQFEHRFRIAVRKLEDDVIASKATAEAIVVYNKLLLALQKSANKCLFEFLIPVAVLKNSPYSNNILDVLETLMNGLPEKQLELFQVPLKIFRTSNLSYIYRERKFLNDGSQDSEIEKKLRIGVVEWFLIPMLKLADARASKMFYLDEINFIVTTAESSIEQNRAQEANFLMSQIVALSLLETFYDTVDNINSEAFKRKLFSEDYETQSIHKRTSKTVRSIALQNPVIAKENVELLMKLRSHAFNCLIKILRKTRIDNNDRTDDCLKHIFEHKVIWKHIIKTESDIKLTMSVEKARARRKEIIRKRREMTSDELSISTEYATCSSLAPEISKYDTNHFTVSNNTKVVVEDVDLFCEEREEDELNSHECMATLCDLIRFLEDHGRLVNVDENNEAIFPKWMQCIRDALIYFQNVKNISYFILKFIINCESAFRPFAKQWFPTLMDTLIKLNQLNYVVTDIVLMMLQWRSQVLPRDRQKTSTLFKVFLSKISNYGTNSRKYLLEMMKAMIQVWHPYFDVPYNDVKQLLSDSCQIGLEISKYFLLNNVFPYDNETMPYVTNLCLNNVAEKGQNQEASKIVGLILRTAAQKNGGILDDTYKIFEKKVIDRMNALNNSSKVKTVDIFTLLEHLVTNYPPLLQRYSGHFLEKFSLLQSDYKRRCLKVLTENVELLPDNALDTLLNNNFEYCLTTTDHDLTLWALNFIKEFMPRMRTDQVERLIDSICLLSTHASFECRDAVYSVANLIYEKYRNETDQVAGKLMTNSKTILLAGLLDSDADLQAKIYQSWKTRSNLEDSIRLRFLNIVNSMYSPLLEAHFICYAVDYLLEGCASSPDYEAPIFTTSLSHYPFKDYEIISSWRKKHTSLAPLLLNSLSDRIYSFNSQKITNGSLSLQEYKTQTQTTSPTISLGVSTAGTSRSLYSKGAFHPFKYIPSAISAEESKFKDDNSTALRNLQRRINEDKFEVSKSHAIRNFKKNEKRREILSDRDRRERNFKLTRRYRKGEIPDVEIKKSELIEPLKVLAKRDPLIAKQIFINVFVAMMAKIKDSEYLSNVKESFNAILRCTQQRDSVCLEAIFEIAYSYPKELKLDLQSIAIGSNMNNLSTLRALLLENALIYDEDVSGPGTSKKRRLTFSNDSLWIQLAEVYKSLDMYDIVNGIFKEKVLSDCCQPLKEGLRSETAGDWEYAYDVYKSEVDRFFSDTVAESQDQRFILDAYYNCAAYLSQWEDINRTIRRKFYPINLNDKWHKNCTLPWLFFSESYQSMEQKKASNLKREITYLLEESEDSSLIEFLAEPLSLLLVMDENRQTARTIVNKSIDSILKELDFNESSIEKFLKLQTLSEISNMLSVFNINNGKAEKEIENICRTWERCEPSKNHTVWWDRRMKYRYLFADLYGKICDQSMDERGPFVSCKLKNYELTSKLIFGEKALEQQNYMLARKYTICAYQQHDNQNSPSQWNFKLATNLCKMYTFQANKKRGAESIELAYEAIRRLNEANTCEHKCEYEYSMTAANLLIVVKNKFDQWSSGNRPDMPKLMTEYNDLYEVPVGKTIFDFFNSDVDKNMASELVDNMIVKYYQQAFETAEQNKFTNEQISCAYLAMAKHCRATVNESNVLLMENHIAISVLKAMKYNSKEAYLLFPVLLQLESVNDNDFVNTFIRLCKEVEEWKFLSWIHQLLVYIDTDKVLLIRDLILRISKKYPKAFQFAFSLTKEALKVNSNSADIFERIENNLPKIDTATNFIKAVSFVCDPAMLWSHYYKILLKSLKTCEEDKLAACRIFENVKNDIEMFSGHFWDTIATILDSALIYLRRNVANYEKMVVNSLNDCKTRLEKNIAKYDKSRLSSYTKWFEEFSEKGIEIELPGQYDGLSIPYPERHVKIYGVNCTVRKISSKQKPIKITITGDDARDYNYLVKFEDIRQDQRIQQLFHIINRALESKFYCQSKHVTLNTYGIFPLKLNLGLIEWISDSVTLKEFRYFGVTEKDKESMIEKYQNMKNKYWNFLGQKYGYGNGRETDVFNYAVQKCTNKSDIVVRFRIHVKNIADDIFKKPLLTMSPDVHSFWSLRNRFMSSYSTMSISNWILGIGDRHLDNILMCTKSGTAIGIDFGYAFGTGTDFLPVPELIPFRMTPHIVSVMEPFGVTGCIRETMIQVLQTIRENDYVLLATMPVFILDPTLNWCEYAKKQYQLDNVQDQDSKSYFENKINNVKLKLQGHHPVNVTINELRRNPNITRFCNNYEKLVQQSDGVKIPLENNCLKTEEQVDCLLGISCDEFVLGTSWIGLETWF